MTITIQLTVSRFSFQYTTQRPNKKKKRKKKKRAYRPSAQLTGRFFKSSSTSTHSDGSLNILNTMCPGTLALALHTLFCSSALFLSPSLMLRYLERERSEEEVSGLSAPAPDRDGEGFALFLLCGRREGRDGGGAETETPSVVCVLRRVGDALRFGFGLAPERALMFDFRTLALSGD